MFPIKNQECNLGEYHMKAFLYFSLIFFSEKNNKISNPLTLIKEITSHLNV